MYQTIDAKKMYEEEKAAIEAIEAAAENIQSLRLLVASGEVVAIDQTWQGRKAYGLLLGFVRTNRTVRCLHDQLITQPTSTEATSTVGNTTYTIYRTFKN